MDTVNQLFKNFIHNFISQFPGDKLVCNDLFSRPSLTGPVLLQQPYDKDGFAMRNIQNDKALAKGFHKS